MVRIPQQLSPAQQSLQKACFRLCVTLQKVVNQGLDSVTDDLQQRAGLKLISKYPRKKYNQPSMTPTSSACPQEVLLFSKKTEDHLRGMIDFDHKPVWATTNQNSWGNLPQTEDTISDKALDQIDYLVIVMTDKEASELSEVIHRVLDHEQDPVLVNSYPIASLLESDTLWCSLSGEENDIDRSVYASRGEDIFEGVPSIRELLVSDDDHERQPDPRFTDYEFVIDPLAIYVSLKSHHATPTCFIPQRIYPYTQSDIRYIIRHKNPYVEYYALKILRCAVSLRQPVASLTRVVRAHELSHLVTHLGLDESGCHWHNFHRESKDLIEGSAQDLTERFLMWRLFERTSRGEQEARRDVQCYLTLLSYQSSPYLAHRDWRNHLPTPEMRRVWLLMYRSLGDSQLMMDFNKILQSRLKNHP